MFLWSQHLFWFSNTCYCRYDYVFIECVSVELARNLIGEEELIAKKIKEFWFVFVVQNLKIKKKQSSMEFISPSTEAKQSFL